jgi:replication-associated recombination protein RarA
MGKEIIKEISVFVGPAGSGKTRLAGELARNFKKEEVVYTTAGELMERFEKWQFSDCTPKTTLLIIDEIPNTKAFEHWLNKVYRYIYVEKYQQSAFIISPDVILICSGSVTREHLDALGSSVAAKCLIYEVEELMVQNKKPERV